MKQYVQQADAICRKANVRQTALLRKISQVASGPPSKAAREAIVFAAGIPPLEEEAAELADLVPAGKEKQAEALVAAIKKGIAEAKAKPIPFAESQIAPFAPAEQIAAQLGLQVCGQP